MAIILADIIGASLTEGPQGPQGPNGPQGVAGPQGNQGSTGPQGPTGAQGNQGDAGPQGPQGATGNQGSQGEQGIVGPAGPQGAVGSTGAQGDAGPQGNQGDTGPQGNQGDIGPQGPQGTAGPQGPQGVDGVQGPQGYQGKDGSFGGAGFDFTYTTLTANAEPGDGFLNFDNTNLTAVTKLYIDQTDGSNANTFNYLQTIDDSTSSIKGTFVIKEVANNDNFAFFSITGSHTHHTHYFEVPVAHLTGATSFSNNTPINITFARTGDQGDVGPQGPQGTAGPQGPNGPQGAQGDASTIPGPQGPQGNDGLTGPQGATGSQGDAGINGPAGPQGPAGSTGPQGPQGTQGTAGAASNWTIKTSNYTAVTGDRIIADTSGGSFTVTLPATPSTGDTVEFVDGGQWGVNNLTVARNGSTIEGQSDNLLLDATGVTVLLVYGTSTWQISTNLGVSGPQGAQGSSGAQGAAGAAGATGPQGPNGPNGPQGPQGSSTSSTLFATNDLSTTALYPVMVNATGQSAPVNTTTSKLYFNAGTGVLNATAFNSLSDIKEKENIATIKDSLNKVLQLRGVEYTLKSSKQDSIGVIAQEIEKIIPQVVSTDDLNRKTVSYGNLIGLLIEAIKEQQTQIDEIKKQLD